MGVPPLHHFKITCPDGQAVLTRVEMDGKLMWGVSAVRFEVGPPGYKQGDAILTLQLYADVEIVGEPEIVKEWRNAKEGSH
jgi:hypothetical protein